MEQFKQEARAITGEDDLSMARLPGISVSVRSPRFTYDGSFGYKSLKPDADPVDLDTIYFIASCTKLLTAIASMQCIEKGLITLDEDVASILPEWKNPQLLVGFDTGPDGTETPKFKPASNKITLRRLLTHSSGMAYEFMNSDLIRWRACTGTMGKMMSENVTDRHTIPLIYEPGQGFAYSCSIDWVGLIVERLSGMSLDDYFNTNIFGPLNIKDTCFYPANNPSMRDRIVPMHIRHDGPKSPHKLKQSDKVPGEIFKGPNNLSHTKNTCAGGGGVYSCGRDFVQILGSLAYNDGKLLRPESVEALFTPSLENPKYLHEFIDGFSLDHDKTMFRTGLPASVKVGWGLGGMVSLEDSPNGRRKGSMMWSGIANTFWWIDPKSHTYAFYAVNVMPPGDQTNMRMMQLFEKAVYEEVKLCEAAKGSKSSDAKL